MTLDEYKTLGGVHPETAAVKNILEFHGVTAPHTGGPFREAMLLGIGGGLEGINNTEMGALSSLRSFVSEYN